MDSEGNTRLLSALVPNALAQAAERFWRKTLNASDTQAPTVMNVDKNAAYPPPIDHLKADEQLPETTELRQAKYLNNRVERSAPIPLRD